MHSNMGRWDGSVSDNPPIGMRTSYTLVYSPSQFHYIRVHLPTYRHTHTHTHTHTRRRTYSAVIFRIILTGGHVVVFRTITDLRAYSSCKLRNQMYDIDYDLYNCFIIVFFRYVKRRRTHHGRENLYESKFNSLHFIICIYCKIKKM